MTGTIQADGTVLGDDGNTYYLPKRLDGVLVDSKLFNGTGESQRQPVKGLLGQKVTFSVSPTGVGFNFTVIK